MDTQTIDQEFDKLQAQFQDVAATVESLAAKLQAAQKAGDANATEWMADLEHIAHDIDGEQAQVKSLLLAIHAFINGLAQAHAQETAPASAPAGDGSAGAQGQPLFAPGADPFTQGQGQGQPQQPVQQMPHRGILAGMFGGGMFGGGMMGGGYYGSSFGQAMEMGVGMSLGADLINSIFR